MPRQLQQHSKPEKISVAGLTKLGLVMKPFGKKTPQPPIQIKKYEDTAAAGNRLFEDVGALLTPIKSTPDAKRNEKQTKQQQDKRTTYPKGRTERNLWRNDEIHEMMYVMRKVNAVERLKDKHIKGDDIFKEVEVIMRANGFVKKNHDQIWTKWKFLKSTYMTSRRNNTMPRIISLEIYNELDQMINAANGGNTSTNGSLNGEVPIAQFGSSSFSSSDANNTLQNTKDEENLDVAHPIFGFRLGLVKNEPVDNGYENNDSTTDNNLLKEIPAPEHTRHQPTPEKEKPVEKKVIVPPRGRGRPPKNRPPLSTSTPNSSQSSTPVGINSKLPPVKAASFAKAANSANTLATSRRTPLPLIMPATPKPIHVANFSSSGDSKLSENRPVRLFEQKLVPKILPHYPTQQKVQVLRFPKEICAQAGRRSGSPKSSYPKLKPVPIRKTPYSLRPDRLIPDLDASISPPPTPEKKRKLDEVPSTSHQAKQTNGKRENDVSNKLRSDQPLRTHSLPINPQNISTGNDEQADTVDRQQRGLDEHMYVKLMQSAIIDMTSSLRKTQSEMITDFFEKQHRLLEKEHAFQMQQDRLIMETFQKQTQDIMGSMRNMVTTIDSDQRNQRRFYRQSKQTTLLNAERSQKIRGHQYRHNNKQAANIKSKTGESSTDDEQLNARAVNNISRGVSTIEKDIHNMFDTKNLAFHNRSKIRNNYDEDDDDDFFSTDDDDVESESSLWMNGVDDNHEHILPNAVSD